jgi:hypothetical protein
MTYKRHYWGMPGIGARTPLDRPRMTNFFAFCFAKINIGILEGKRDLGTLPFAGFP